MSYISLGSSISVRENKNGSVSYYYSFRENGKTKRKKILTAKKHTEANFKKALLLAKQTKEENSDKVTINNLSEKYFESRYIKMKSQLRQKYNYLSEKDFDDDVNVRQKLLGVKSEEQRYKKNISTSKIANMNLHAIKRQDIKDFVDKDLSTKGLSQKTIYNMISLIKTIINFGIRNELCNINPFSNFKIKNPKRKRQRYLNREELELLLKTAKEYPNPNVYMSIYLAVITAGRLRSILNIQKKDIDFENCFIRLDNFKSNKFYTVKIPKKASEWLKKQCENLDSDDYLIRYHHKTPEKKPMLDCPDAVYKIMDKLFNQGLNKQNNLDRDNVVNFHTIRRSIATNLALEGVDIYKIMLLLNHSSVKQTQDYLNLSNIIMTNELEEFHSKLFADF